MERITLLDLGKEIKNQKEFRLESQTPTDSLQVCLKFNKMYVDITAKYIVLRNENNGEIYICSIKSVYKSLTNAGIVYYLICKQDDSNDKAKQNKYKLIPVDFKKIS